MRLIKFLMSFSFIVTLGAFMSHPAWSGCSGMPHMGSYFHYVVTSPVNAAKNGRDYTITVTAAAAHPYNASNQVQPIINCTEATTANEHNTIALVVPAGWNSINVIPTTAGKAPVFAAPIVSVTTNTPVNNIYPAMINIVSPAGVTLASTFSINAPAFSTEVQAESVALGTGPNGQPQTSEVIGNTVYNTNTITFQGNQTFPNYLYVRYANNFVFNSLTMSSQNGMLQAWDENNITGNTLNAASVQGYVTNNMAISTINNLSFLYLWSYTAQNFPSNVTNINWATPYNRDYFMVGDTQMNINSPVSFSDYLNAGGDGVSMYANMEWGNNGNTKVICGANDLCGMGQPWFQH